MNIQETITPQFLLELAQACSTTEINWLVNQLTKLRDQKTVPQSLTLEAAIAGFLADQYSLGKAAELAGVTRWELQEELANRQMTIEIYTNKTVAQMEALEDTLERQGLLCAL